MRLVFTGGGTAGHVYPNLAIASVLRRREEQRGLPSAEGVAMLYVGTPWGLERALVTRAGLPYAAIAAGPLRASPWRAVVNGGRLLLGLWQGLGLLGRFRPQAIMATGGYSCVPLVIAGWLKGIPTLLCLPDVVPGWAVRLLARLARRITVSTPQATTGLPRKKVVVTGYPTRPELLQQDHQEALGHLGLNPQLKTLLVIGGSRGAQQINAAIAQILPQWLSLGQVIHLCGPQDYYALRQQREALSAELRERYHLYAYLHEEFGYALAAADVALSRAGASVLGEYPAVGLPSVLIPYRYAGGHQGANAQWLADHGAAVIVEEGRLEDLWATVRALLADAERRAQMSAAARALHRPDAAEKVAELLLELGRQKGADDAPPKR